MRPCARDSHDDVLAGGGCVGYRRRHHAVQREGVVAALLLVPHPTRGRRRTVVRAVGRVRAHVGRGANRRVPASAAPTGADRRRRPRRRCLAGLDPLCTQTQQPRLLGSQAYHDPVLPQVCRRRHLPRGRQQVADQHARRPQALPRRLEGEKQVPFTRHLHRRPPAHVVLRAAVVRHCLCALRRAGALGAGREDQTLGRVAQARHRAVGGDGCLAELASREHRRVEALRAQPRHAQPRRGPVRGLRKQRRQSTLGLVAAQLGVRPRRALPPQQLRVTARGVPRGAGGRRGRAWHRRGGRRYRCGGGRGGRCRRHRRRCSLRSRRRRRRCGRRGGLRSSRRRP
eukprot:Rhum_TRINITY_DN14082_c19_g1::Rhum_TRINITY_DN14082_c19_g1_i1::g.67174::m.67174